MLDMSIQAELKHRSWGGCGLRLRCGHCHSVAVWESQGQWDQGEAALWDEVSRRMEEAGRNQASRHEAAPPVRISSGGEACWGERGAAWSRLAAWGVAALEGLAAAAAGGEGVEATQGISCRGGGAWCSGAPSPPLFVRELREGMNMRFHFF